ncbi:uncharacterized protein C8R40DRAFT_1173527 [Lentinula edodes]|uniref:uncharacterized protein n=1 Tax=Lentinula edodes TaxID=5353 RepID=UPI001E8DC3BB|nr:uncharacterized protein C8R40DRAFT_1173527 [Lentinula edodes]KAH7872425.1 hypothetical protein C8R40DRAFT_1173527 [Lentinula edodes]
MDPIRSATQHIHQHAYAHTELLIPNIFPSLDRRVLISPARTIRAVRRTVPYKTPPSPRHRCSLSPDPNFRSFCESAGCTSDNEETIPILSGRRTISAPRAVRFADLSTQNGTSVLQGNGNRLDPTDNQISKPPGVMAKPGQGGYSLRMELDWTNDQFESVQVWIFIQFIIPSLRSYSSQKYIGETVEGVLDVTQSFDEQSLMNIKQIQQMAVHKYPFLNVYRKHWVVNDFIKCHLNSLKNKTQTEPTARLPGDYRVIQTRGRSRRSINTKLVGALND